MKRVLPMKRVISMKRILSMKRTLPLKSITALFIIMMLASGLMPLEAFAREGDSGYEGGISSGYSPGKTVWDYQEVCFITGEPIVLKGTLTVTKKQKNSTMTATYRYALKNTDKAVTLSRTQVFNDTFQNADNGQTVESVAYSPTPLPQETIKVGSTIYTLNGSTASFTRSTIVDPKPAINYYRGDLQEKKTYNIGTNGSGGTVTVETTGSYYGYDQYWGSSEVEILSISIDSGKVANNAADKWGGTAKVTLSSTVTNELSQYQNLPDQISFRGGYTLTQYNNNVLEYECSLPEFDSKGLATDNMLDKSGSLKLETYPVKTMLPVADLTNIRGHWAEQDISLMFGLGVFQGDSKNFKPDQYITKAEFAQAITQAAKEVPPDPALAKKTTVTAPAGNKKNTVVSPFDDVSVDNKYFNAIQSAYNRGLLDGKGHNLFGPNDSITKAEALTAFIRATGLESMASGSDAVTTFKDNDLIPSYARKAAYVAQKIGLVSGDGKGNLNPGRKLTKAEAATMISRLISYLQDGIKSDYRDGILNY